MMSYSSPMHYYTHSIQVYRHSFRPLVYSFSKQHETTQAVRMAMDGMQYVAMKYFSHYLRPSASVSDHCDGLREGMSYILKPPWLPEEETPTQPKLPHLGDWAHIATHYRKGRLLSKTNPYYDEVWTHLQAVHFAHTKEMKTLLESLIYDVWGNWEAHGQVRSLYLSARYLLHLYIAMDTLYCTMDHLYFLLPRRGNQRDIPRRISGTSTSWSPGMSSASPRTMQSQRARRLRTFLVSSLPTSARNPGTRW